MEELHGSHRWKNCAEIDIAKQNLHNGLQYAYDNQFFLKDVMQWQTDNLV